MKRLKSYILISIISISYFLHGQNTTNKFNPNDFIVENYENGQIKSKGKKNKNGQKIGTWNLWYENGQLKEDATYNEGNLTGKKLEFYINGQIKSESFYQNGQLHGSLATFFDNGNKKRKDQYQNGKFIQGECYDINGLILEHFDYQINPEFPGGQNALFNFIQKNVIYPDIPKRNNIQGTVFVNFSISDIDGSIENINILRSPDEYLSEEAIRVVKLMPNWSIGEIDGVKTSMSFNLPFKFSLK
jgi:protein TonB